AQDRGGQLRSIHNLKCFTPLPILSRKSHVTLGSPARAVRYSPMITRPLGKQDYDHIVQIIDRWWGGPTTALAHPIFFYELGAMARVVEHDGILVGFLLGF